MASTDASPNNAIQAIDRKSVHRICSGQVVLNLATAAKELVENSLDAGATNIEIRLKDYGSELLEVVDNGSGVEEQNFEGLTLKHHTSKLQDFSDLTNVATFGFRGEALSSLCALSKVQIITCHQSASVGTKLEYDHNGKIVQQTPCARQTGTTVSIQQIFSTLPVRHKEFLRNLKKEFAKMVQVLNSYCIIAVGTRITCTNVTDKGRKSTVVSTKGNDTVKENITNIFGPKQLSSLLEVIQYDPSEEVCVELGIKLPENYQPAVRIEGYVSSCEHGQGRSSCDRQFFFINKRPCDLAKVSKVVNEVFHMYNRHQYPFIVLNISMEKESVDVNVTPDKRQIFFQEEKLLLAVIKSSLIKLYEPRASVFQMSNPLKQFQSRITGGTLPSSDSTSIEDGNAPGQPVVKSISSSLATLKRSFASAFTKDSKTDTEESRDKKQGNKQCRLDGFLNSQKSPTIHANTCASKATYSSASWLPNTKHEDDSETMNSSSTGSQCSIIFESQSSSTGSQSICDDVTVVEENTHCLEQIRQGGLSEEQELKTSALSEHEDLTLNADVDALETPSKHCDKQSSTQVGSGSFKVTHTIMKSDESKLPLGRHVEFEKEAEMQGNVVEEISDKDNGPLYNECDTNKTDDKPKENEHEIIYTEVDSNQSARSKKTVCVPFKFETLKTSLKAHPVAEIKQLSRNFRATISPADNQNAEDELRKEITKDMFEKMEILGQFNLGFIIAKLGADLFIIDQHATDEKYNFEMLQKNTVIESQKLILPQNLELTSVNEGVLIDNIEVFKKNGFEFIIDEDGEPCKRVKLVSLPVSKNWTFGREDIEELIFMLTDSPGTMCRPTRVRQMFASRACRKSIMIGTALNKSEMNKLVSHMGQIEQPWNCPHGRPTMRHLINLDMLPD